MGLYGKVEPPGDPILINIDPFEINDAIATESKIRTVVKGLRNDGAGGVAGIKEYHMKQWLRGDVRGEEKEDTELDKKWSMFVKLIQNIWEKCEIPQQMSWMAVVLILKGGGDYHGIGLLEPF